MMLLYIRPITSLHVFLSKSDPVSSSSADCGCPYRFWCPAGFACTTTSVATTASITASSLTSATSDGVTVAADGNRDLKEHFTR